MIWKSIYTIDWEEARELNVFSEIIPYQNVSNKTLENYNPKAVILSGGPSEGQAREKFPHTSQISLI
ncbi:MAG: hypothetical protein CM15mP81_18420 [Alphaproteobacteria bacterium]|nr:MAG: hypothetical protein CM15mP81_18420 [Alphaproteobacteria bacterium]